MKPTSEQPALHRSPSPTNEGAVSRPSQRRTDPQPRADASASQSEPVPASSSLNLDQRSPGARDYSRTSDDAQLDSTRDSSSNLSPATPTRPRLSGAFRSAPPISPTPARPVSPFSQALVPSDSTRGRRAQDDFDYQQPHNPDPQRRNAADPSPEPAPLASTRPAFQSDPAGPAWLYASPAQPVAAKPLAPQQPSQFNPLLPIPSSTPGNASQLAGMPSRACSSSPARISLKPHLCVRRRPGHRSSPSSPSLVGLAKPASSPPLDARSLLHGGEGPAHRHHLARPAAVLLRRQRACATEPCAPSLRPAAAPTLRSTSSATT